MASAYRSSKYGLELPSLPLHLCFFLLVLFLFMGISWYTSYESILEDLFDQIKLFLILSPLLLLLLVHLLSSGSDRRHRVPFFIPLPEKDSLHRAGGTPWGVAALLVFLLFMVSHHSSLQERLFPLLSR